ncbi:MAG: YgiQ family radical SAM protein, partial [Ruthenibacterium lactatiformans]
VTGDAYVDHPSFGAAIISRLLEAEGYRVGVLSQPDFTTCESMKEFGRPRYGFFIGGGNVDSMVAHYSVAKIRRAQDEYTPGGAAGKRPDRSATVYTQLAKQAYPDLPVILGGLEASLRRFAHYDYWLDDVLPSIVESSGADIVSFGMGERQTAEIARRLAAGEPVEEITGVAGTCYLTDFAGLPASYGVRLFCQCARTRRHMPSLPHPDAQPGCLASRGAKTIGRIWQNIPAAPLTRRS